MDHTNICVAGTECLPSPGGSPQGCQFPYIASKPACYDIEGFVPLKIDRDFLSEVGVDYAISPPIASQLLMGSEWFSELYKTRNLTPGDRYLESLTDTDQELEIHNYTGICPTNVLEVSPSTGSCAVACQYCLVTDGNHVKPITVYTNYAKRLAHSLERNCHNPIFYYLRHILEPNAASVEERLDALVECRELGMWAESVLCQPLLLPYLTEENIQGYFAQLKSAGVRNVKPEFLTTEIRNLVLLAQYINHYDPDLIDEFFRPYLTDENQDHIKQRSRLAPERAVCVEKLSKIRNAAEQQGITISICNWVKRELSVNAQWVSTVDQASAANGYRCLGYQIGLFPQNQDFHFIQR